MVNGHVLLTNILFQVPIQKFQIPAIVMKADYLTAIFPLHVLAKQSAIDIWASLSGTGRARICGSCLPPLCLSTNCQMYQFLDGNGRVVKPEAAVTYTEEEKQ